VLGAGGVTGAAFHAGVLLALEHDFGWDPRSAELVLGTSAGAVVAALVRAGLNTDDLAAWAAPANARRAGAASRQVLDEIDRHPFALARPHLRVPRPAATVVRRMVCPDGVGLHTSLISLLPGGWIDAGRSLQRLDALVPRWPEEALWIPAVRKADGQRVVFGRDDRTATPAQAIASSSAIPALFAPVTIGGSCYIDGAAHSPTNADLLVDSGVDVAIVVAPMSTRRHAANVLHPTELLRIVARRRLDVECRTLEAAGIEVFRFEPGAAVVDEMGLDALDRARTGAVAREAFLDAGAHAASDRNLRRTLAATARQAHRTAGVPRR
jgi:NTE family protein